MAKKASSDTDLMIQFCLPYIEIYEISYFKMSYLK